MQVPAGSRARTAFAVLALAALAYLLAAPGAEAAPKIVKKGPLVYIFSLDGLERTAVTRDADAPYLSSLINDRNGARGAFFPRSRSVMVAETNPNHTSMITGAYPRTHGITGNAFATYGSAADGFCPRRYNPSARPVATTGESPACLQAETVFETLERQLPEYKATTALIMGKPKLARLFATRNQNPGGYDPDYIWSPCDDDEPYCEEVPTNPINGYAESDSIVMDEVIRTTREGVSDGRRARVPNFTFVNFPVIDSAGHASGREGPIYASAVEDADVQIRRFVANQKRLGVWKRTVMMIVSDHAMDTTQQFAKVSLQAVLTAGGIPSSAYSIVGNGTAAHIYLNDRTARTRNVLLERMRNALASSSGVSQALYRRSNSADGGNRNTINGRSKGWGLGGPRAGDIVVSMKPGIGVIETSEASSFPFNPLPGNHGSTFTRDNFWLVAGGGKGIRTSDSQRKITNANAAPTATHLLGAQAPKQSDTNWVRQAFTKRLRR